MWRRNRSTHHSTTPIPPTTPTVPDINNHNNHNNNNATTTHITTTATTRSVDVGTEIGVSSGSGGMIDISVPTIAVVPPTFEAQNRQQPIQPQHENHHRRRHNHHHHHSPYRETNQQQQQNGVRRDTTTTMSNPTSTSFLFSSFLQTNPIRSLTSTATVRNQNQHQQQQQQQQQQQSSLRYQQQEQEPLFGLQETAHIREGLGSEFNISNRNNGSASSVNSNNNNSRNNSYNEISLDNNNNNHTITSTTTSGQPLPLSQQQALPSLPQQPLLGSGSGAGVPVEPTAYALWRERERRQRTIRVFMMFLLILLLMEEEPNKSSARHPSNQNSNTNSNQQGLLPFTTTSQQQQNSHPNYHFLRHSTSVSNHVSPTTKARTTTTGTNTNFEQMIDSSSNQNQNHSPTSRYDYVSIDVYHSRIQQDEHIRMICRSHPRYIELMKKQMDYQQQYQQQHNNYNYYYNPSFSSSSSSYRSSTKTKTTSKTASTTTLELLQEYDYNELILQDVLSIQDMEKDEFDNQPLPSTMNIIGGDVDAVPSQSLHHHHLRGSSSSSISNNNSNSHRRTADIENLGYTYDDEVQGFMNHNKNNYNSNVNNGGGSSSSSVGETSSNSDLMKDHQKVLHYPWNTTGFYRGVWKLIEEEDYDENENDDTDVENVPSKMISSSQKTKMMYHDRRLNSVFARGRNNTNNLNKTTIATSNHNTSYEGLRRTYYQKFNVDAVSAPSMENIMFQYIQKQRQRYKYTPTEQTIGVFLVPMSHRLMIRDDHNYTYMEYENLRIDLNGYIQPPIDFNKIRQLRYNQSTGATTPSNLNSYLLKNNQINYHHPFLLPFMTKQQSPTSATTTPVTGSNSTTTTNNNHEKYIPLQPVTLTRNNGRVAFQLFSRSVPEMKEISIVDGFIKLYDSTVQGFSTSKDILLRVRGVMIHSIGRLSLTANADVSQIAFVFPPPPLTTTTTTTTKTGSLKSPRVPSSVSRSTSMPFSTATVRQTNFDTSASTSHEQAADTTSQNDTNIAPNFFQDESIYERWHRHRHRRLEEMKHLLKTGDIEQFRDKTLEFYDHDIRSGNEGHEQNQSKKITANENVVQWNYNVPNNVPMNEYDSKMIDKYKSIISQILHKDDYKVQEQVGTYRNFFHRLLKSFHEEPVGTEEGEGLYSSRYKGDRTEEEDYDETSDSTRVMEDITAPLSPVHEEKLYVDVETHSKDSNSTEASKPNVKVEGDKILPSNQGQENSVLLPPWSDYVIPFPFVKDDQHETLRRIRTPAARLMPPREELLEANAAHCLFEINMDVNPIEWPVSSWWKLINRHVTDMKTFQPNQFMNDGGSEQQRTKDDTQSTRTTNHYTHLLAIEDQALAMGMVGDIRSTNCNFKARLNVTAIRTDWDATINKAINYSFYMMLVCLIQILILLRQLLHSQSNSTATRVSILCIGWQTIIDAKLCLAHIYLSLAVQRLFTAFACVAFFKLLIFCVIEMKYMAIITQARNNSNGGRPPEVFRRQVAILHIRFYTTLVAVILLFSYASTRYRLYVTLGMYSFWVPQIILNIITEAKNPMHRYYIYGMSVTRLVVPLYMLALPGNFLKQVYPDSPLDIFTCEMLILWIGFQTAILMGQSKYGARFMIPAKFLPPRYDYSRPIPQSMLPAGAGAAILCYNQKLNNNEPTEISSSKEGRTKLTISSSSPSVLVDESTVNLRSRTERHNTTAVTTRNRLRGNRYNRDNGVENMTTETHTIHEAASPTLSSSSESTTNSDVRKKSISTATASTSLSSHTVPTCCILECSICCDTIDVRKRLDYMLAPCNHLFHRECLAKWMDVKMECPICRTELPPAT